MYLFLVQVPGSSIPGHTPSSATKGFHFFFYSGIFLAYYGIQKLEVLTLLVCDILESNKPVHYFFWQQPFLRYCFHI